MRKGIFSAELLKVSFLSLPLMFWLWESASSLENDGVNFCQHLLKEQEPLEEHMNLEVVCCHHS